MNISFECKQQELELLLKCIDFEDIDFALSSFLLIGLRGFLDYSDEVNRKSEDYEEFKKICIA